MSSGVLLLLFYSGGYFNGTRHSPRASRSKLGQGTRYILPAQPAAFGRPTLQTRPNRQAARPRTRSFPGWPILKYYFYLAPSLPRNRALVSADWARQGAKAALRHESHGSPPKPPLRPSAALPQPVPKPTLSSVPEAVALAAQHGLSKHRWECRREH